MKRAGNQGNQENNDRIPSDLGSGKLIIAFSNSGTVIKFRRVEVSKTNNLPLAPHNCSFLPFELYKSILEYSIQGMLDHLKLPILLKINTVSKSFNLAVNQIIEEMLRSSDILALLFGRMLNAGEWISPAVYYSFAFRWLSANTCPNTEGAKNLLQICNTVSNAFETKILSLANSDSAIKKTDDGFNIECNGRTIKFNKSNASIHALNLFIQHYCINAQIFKTRCFDQHPHLIDFLEEYNSKEQFAKIIGQQISFFCDNLLDQPISSVNYLITLLKKGLVTQESIPILKHTFQILQNRMIDSTVRTYIPRLLKQLLKMNLVRLHPQDVQFLRSFVFAEFSAPIDPNFPVQRQDAAMGMIQELIAAGYTLDLTAAEMKILKDHAIERLAYQYGDVDFKHDILELLGFITQREEWFSLVSVPLFECILSLLIKSNQQYSPFQTQRLITFYDILIKHPQEIICSLATQISILIKGGALALKNHLLIMLQDSSSTLINNLAIMSLHNLLTSDYSLALTNFELEALKAYANRKFKDNTVDLLIQQNLIELLLHFVPETTELFPIVSLKFFEGIKSFILSNKKIYTPSIAQKLTKIYDQFLGHPNQQIALVAAEISLLIAGILPDES